MASSIASLAIAGFMAELTLGRPTGFGLPWDKWGGGGGAAGSGAVQTVVEVAEAEEGEGEDGLSEMLSFSDAVFLNMSSSSAASHLVWEKQRAEKRQ